MDFKDLIRHVPDFPKKGIGFKDITTVLKDAEAFRRAVQGMVEPFRNRTIDLVVGIESRGFIFGGVAAHELGAGFVPARKPGKLPAQTVRESYSLEYGTDAVEIHADAISEGRKVLIVDDLLATGGTAAACVRLVKKLGGDIVGAAFFIELDFLDGRRKLGNIPVHTLVRFASE